MSGLRKLYEHHLWANLRLLDACEALPEAILNGRVDGTYGTVTATLMHLVSSEEGYTARLLTGERVTDALDEEGPFPGFDELRRRLRNTGEALVDGIEAEDPEHTYLVDGGKLVSTAALFLVQAINHGTEHRAHVNTTISTLGAEPVGLDAWEWGFATGQLRAPE